MASGASNIQFIRENIKKELAGLYPEREILSITNILFRHRLHMEPHESGLRKQEILMPGDLEWFNNAIGRIKRYTPVQHITGETEFFGLKLMVSPAALIPRPETEELVQWILDDAAGEGFRSGEGSRILDVGTGTGCIALALKKNLPGASIFATDVEPAALDLARENSRRLGLPVDFLHHDIRTGTLLQEYVRHRQGNASHINGFPELDLIVSNPPYIPEGEQESLDANVRYFEPASALFVPDEDPLVYCRHIALFGRRSLRTSGMLYLEIHEEYGPQTRQLLEESGYEDTRLRKDINGKTRMIRARRK